MIPDTELLPIEELMAIAEVNEEDALEAIAWWDEYASEDFIGALD